MKHSCGLAAVFSQRSKKRGLVARLNAPQNIQMQIETIFLLVKDARELLRDIAGNILYRRIGNQV